MRERERVTLSDDMHSNSNDFNPASVACVKAVAGKLDVSYAQIRVSSKSRTIVSFSKLLSSLRLTRSPWTLTSAAGGDSVQGSSTIGKGLKAGEEEERN